MSKVGIVVVTLNSGKYIGACLDAALRTGAEVVVVDNGSRDGTLEETRRRPCARLVANTCNRGFAGAVNQGFRELDCPFVLLLNPDAFIATPLDGLIEACSQPGVGAAGGKLVDESGETQVGFLVRRFPTPLILILETLGVNRIWKNNPPNRRYRALDLDYDHPAEVDQPAGSFLMVRREVWERIGGLDERFHPVWFEDVDFCKRVVDSGYRIRYVPGVVAKHVGGHSARGVPWEERKLAWNLNLIRYSLKHFSSLSGRVVCTSVGLGSLVRLAPELVLQRSLEPFRVHTRIMKFVTAGLLRGRVNAPEINRRPLLRG